MRHNFASGYYVYKMLSWLSAGGNTSGRMYECVQKGRVKAEAEKLSGLCVVWSGRG